MHFEKEVFHKSTVENWVNLSIFQSLLGHSRIKSKAQTDYGTFCTVFPQQKTHLSFARWCTIHVAHVLEERLSKCVVIALNEYADCSQDADIYQPHSFADLQ